MVRVAVAAAAVCLALAPAMAADRPTLRAEVTAQRDVLSLADLVEGVQGAPADRPLFRAPALGESGTIQARRILEAAADLGYGAVDLAGRQQVVVTRTARRIGASEIEAAIKRSLELQHGVDARAASVLFEGAPPALAVAPDVKAPLGVEDVLYDRRSRQVSAVVFVPVAGSERRVQRRVLGRVVELVEVALLTRALNRGETVQPSDVAVERRVRESVPADVQADAPVLAGRVARRALAAGAVLRSGDLAKPELVARGDLVTIVYEVPGMTLTLRGRAQDGGALGDTIAVLNPQSKKTLQATVAAPGRVSVGPSAPGPVAAIPAPAIP